jgi:hypothetical protein
MEVLVEDSVVLLRVLLHASDEPSDVSAPLAVDEEHEDRL